MQKVVIIGAGNVAHHLGEAIKSAGLEIIQVYSKSMEAARVLGKRLDTEYTDDLKLISEKADLFLLAIKDEHIKNMASDLKQWPGLLVHTSGSISMDVLANTGDCSYGVFYPLQTFSKNVDLGHPEYPICIEANNVESEKKLRGLAEKVVGKQYVYRLNSEQRKALHIAAVFTCNFCNHMHVIAEKLLEKEGMDFQLLVPLIKETTGKLLKNNPSAIQTGPAKRNDQEVINDHLKFLSKDPGYKELYQMITNSIIENNTK